MSSTKYTTLFWWINSKENYHLNIRCDYQIPLSMKINESEYGVGTRRACDNVIL